MNTKSDSPPKPRPEPFRVTVRRVSRPWTPERAAARARFWEAMAMSVASDDEPCQDHSDAA